ncbi:hypothetical protein J3Q64DRAFT_1698013 [Phycomyces blakesleeanus]|uniref:PB1 domain-containing protein n=2 Tax=Phycomyces blakesleeanus TaxID=4837 RepID=A0A163A3Y0_PHYB8|nr:hypothetical protein PHYBLDRAFT_170991 [Phycomyces blakesleeanus NRRL 1555(-)]OAD70911.1 hypothetical protein PHYBLDRAFT_170991 [Phycomyces blakesleeanus NRRL 1555(-)]|eukprot:XP_018288951.1 hypothetical protein PHYBLDRAFT_170991 [Phycomyces blakesleeanus NRRL 1555(-)]
MSDRIVESNGLMTANIPPPYKNDTKYYLRLYYENTMTSTTEQRMVALFAIETWTGFLKRLRAKLDMKNIYGIKYLDVNGNFVIVKDQEDIDIAILVHGESAKDPCIGLDAWILLD